MIKTLENFNEYIGMRVYFIGNDHQVGWTTIEGVTVTYSKGGPFIESFTLDTEQHPGLSDHSSFFMQDELFETEDKAKAKIKDPIYKQLVAARHDVAKTNELITYLEKRLEALG